jgi:hypothetical protein
MKKRYFSHIKNPMTIIALFIGLTEVALAIVFQKLPNEFKLPVIWTLVCLPTLCLLGFFTVLYFRPHHLYGPRDFKHDDSYLRLIESTQNSTILGRVTSPKEKETVHSVAKETVMDVYHALSRSFAFYLLSVANQSLTPSQHISTLEKEIEYLPKTSVYSGISEKREADPSSEFGDMLFNTGYLTCVLVNFDRILFDAKHEGGKVQLVITPENMKLLGEIVSSPRS